MARFKWTSSVVLGSMVLGATTLIAPATADDGSRTAPVTGVVTPPVDSRGTPATDTSEETGVEVVRSREARVVPGALAPICGRSASREVVFPLFDDVTVRVVEEGRSTVDGRLVWSGAVDGAVGQDVIVTLDGGCDAKPGNELLSAQFMLGGDVYAVEPSSPGNVTISELTPMAEEDESELAPPPAAPARVRPAAGAPRAPKVVCKGGQNISLVDVLVGYTPKAVKEAGGDAQMRAQVTRGITLANAAFAGSGTRVRLRLVRTTPVSVPAARDKVDQALLRSIADPRDGLADNLHQLRDQYGADLVSVVAGGRDAGGLGYAPENPGPSTVNYGFNVVAQSSIGHYSMGHEIGHNLGASHDRVTQPVQPPPYGANGYFPKDGDWSTIMAYESGCRKATKGSCNRINQFENPRMSYRGEATGVPLGMRNEADTADVFGKTSQGVASYRPPLQTASLCAVTATVSPKGSGVAEASQPGPYPAGSTTVYSATARKGFVFSHWMLNGKKVSGTSAGVRVPVNGDQALVAVFRKGTTPTSTVTTKSKGGGTVKKKPAAKRGAELEGADLLYEAEAKPGWRFTGWQLDDSYAGEDDTIAVDVTEDNMNLTAQFERRTHQLTVGTRGGKGSVSLSESGPYADGDTVFASATPEPGYVFVDWLLDGKSYGGDDEKARGETSLLMEEGDHTLTAVFGCGCKRDS
ncbi:reprolysin-like metallopeptidase [Streptomyces sp. NPDC001941]|uniref:InlB B-repeat-containing protein n=1 Tax=Streptomyces sp. NPDC001941 TaxID=3154659 RepID=UPI0033251014